MVGEISAIKNSDSIDADPTAIPTIIRFMIKISQLFERAQPNDENKKITVEKINDFFQPNL